MDPRSHDDPVIRAATPADAECVARIYNPYVTGTIVTFEEEAVTAEEIARRIESVQSASLPWLVAASEGRVAGYAYAMPWRTRHAYRFTTEVTVYLDPAHAGRGVGSKLYAALLPQIEARGIHSAIGGIALPNDASVRLHEKLGFVKVAHFREVGFKLGQWIDVGYWQRVFRPLQPGGSGP